MKNTLQKHINTIYPKIGCLSVMTSYERIALGYSIINKLTLLQIENLYPQLQKLVGKKVKLKSGDFANGTKPTLLNVSFNDVLGLSYRVYIHFEYNYIKLVNDVTLRDKRYESGGYGVTYYKREEYFKLAENGAMLELSALECYTKKFKESFTAKQISENLSKREKLQDELRKVESELRKVGFRCQ